MSCIVLFSNRSMVHIGVGPDSRSGSSQYRVGPAPIIVLNFGDQNANIFSKSYILTPQFVKIWVFGPKIKEKIRFWSLIQYVVTSNTILHYDNTIQITRPNLSIYIPNKHFFGSYLPNKLPNRLKGMWLCVGLFINDQERKTFKPPKPLVVHPLLWLELKIEVGLGWSLG